MMGYFNSSNLSYTGNFLGKNFTPIEGFGVGFGVDYGYKWNLTEQWNIDCAIGLGYSAFTRPNLNTGHYLGFTKLACSISYILPQQELIITYTILSSAIGVNQL